MRLIWIAFPLALGACSSPQQQEALEPTSGPDAVAPVALAAPKPVMPEPEPVALSSGDMGRVCRAAIGTVMGRDPAIIRVTSTNGNIVAVRYTRDDGTVWSSQCRVEPGKVTWAGIENGTPGRWRNEDSITYSLDGDRITVTESMMGTETYTIP